MENNKNKSFRQKANEITQTPSPRAWEKLEKMLDQNKQKRPRKTRPLWPLVGLAASLLLLFGIVWVNQNPAGEKNQMVATASQDRFEIIQNQPGPYRDFYALVAKARRNGLMGRYKRG